MANSQRTPFGRSLNRWGHTLILAEIQKTGRALPCSVVSAAGSIIKINFELQTDYTLPQIDVPIFGPEYVRYPMQKGDKGVVIAVDAQIGAMCGLGGGTAGLGQPANLGALIFLPIGSKTFTEVDGDAVVIYGPNGVTLRDTDSKSTIVLTPNSIVATHGDGTLTMDDTGVVAKFKESEVALTESATSVAFGTNEVTVNEAGVTITSDGEVIMSGTDSVMSIAWGSNSVAVGPSGIAITGVLTINGAPYLAHKHTGVSTGSGTSGGVAP